MPKTGVPRALKALALGTYYGKKVSNPAPDARQIQQLSYQVKQKSRYPLSRTQITYPGQKPTWVSNQREACDLIAQIWAVAWAEICEHLGVPADGSVILVPVPSSEVTLGTLATARWGAAKLAAAMQRAGLGVIMKCVVNKAATAAVHESEDRQTALQLFQNYQVTQLPDGPVVYVDDIFTQGHHIAAMDECLRRPKQAGVLVIAFTELEHRATCLELRAKRLEYTSLSSHIAVLDDED